MNIKSTLTGLVVATSMFALVGVAEAGRVKQHYNYYGTGWHMVPKSSGIKPAQTWQEYNSGVYTQPIVNKKLF